MKLQLRFLLVLAAIFFFASTLLLLLQYFELGRSQSILASELQTKKTYLAKITELEGQSEQTLVRDYSFWDEMVNFVRTGDLTFAHDNLDNGLTVYGVDADWVFRPDGSLVYFSTINGSSVHRSINLPPAFFKQLASAKFGHFYMKVGNQLLEMRAATIVQGNDPTHQTAARGFFVVGRVLGNNYTGALAALSGSAIALGAPTATADKTTTDTVSFGTVLKDWDGQPVATLRSTSTVPVITDLRQQYYRQFGALAVFAVTSAVFVLTLLWLLVLRPISIVNRAIKQQQPQLLARLRTKKTEFGRLAQTVTDFFTQKIRLADAAFEKTELQKHAHELREEQAKLQASIEGLELGFMLVDRTGKVLVQNSALRTILGQTAAIETPAQLDGMFAKIKLGEICQEVQATRRSQDLNDIDLGPKVLKLFVAPVSLTDQAGTEVIAAVVLVQDVSAEKILARSRDEFFSIASHELRTPLTAITGNASMMMDYYRKILDKDDTLKEMVSDIHASGSRLIAIVSDFLDASRMEQGKMNFKPSVVALDTVVETILYEVRTVIGKKKVKLTTNVKTLQRPIQVWADKARLTQIIYNLIGNATAFTEVGEIAVDVSLDGSLARIRVSDTGSGIPLKNQKLLFHKFQQAGSSLLTRDTTRGTGLGLYISRLLAEGMGGELILEHSVEGKGSTFALTVPLATAEQQKTFATSATAQETVDTTTGLSKDPLIKPTRF